MVNAPLFADNPRYVAYEKLLIELHRLFLDGREDDPKADAIREEMDAPGSTLSDVEIDRLNGLSSDLYLIEGDEAFEVVTDEARSSALAGELKTAFVDHNWEQALKLLRMRPADAPPEKIAHLRVIAYEQLGHSLPAYEFARFAYDLSPEDPLLKFLRIHLADQNGLKEEALLIGLHLGYGSIQDIWWLELYVPLLLSSKNPDRYRRNWEHVRAGLRSILTRSDAPASIHPEIRFFGYYALAVCNLVLGDIPASKMWYEEARVLKPEGEEPNKLLSSLGDSLKTARTGAAEGVLGALLPRNPGGGSDELVRLDPRRRKEGSLWLGQIAADPRTSRLMPSGTLAALQMQISSREAVDASLIYAAAGRS